MKNFLVIAAIGLGTCTIAHAQQASTGTPIATSRPADAAPAASPPPTQGLGDLEAMTFDCPRAGLNAAAREAAKAPSQVTYQFSFFKIIHDAHHALYEVHFKSNYQGEPELKYCVSMYCQQGWDPRTSKVEITLLDNKPKRRGHEASCAAHTKTGR